MRRNSARSAVGPSARRVGRSSAERGRKVEPKAVRNKGIFRAKTTKKRCERLSSVSTRNSRQVATIAAPLGTNESGNPNFRTPRTVEATPIDANCGTARRTTSNRKSRSRSPPPVPTRVSTIKYLAPPRKMRRGKFSSAPPVILNSHCLQSAYFHLLRHSPLFTNSPLTPSSQTAHSNYFNAVGARIGAENLFEKIYSPPFSKS